MTDLGRRYAQAPDEIPGLDGKPVSNPAKQGLLLEICQSFHQYLMKYLVMICRGHIPVLGAGVWIINKDVEGFIRFFLPAGLKMNRQNAFKVVRHFHLAFKGMEMDEIYDVLMAQLIDTVRNYDPDYKRKVKQVVEVIENELSKQKQFTAADLGRYLDLDCHRYLRLLRRCDFLAAVQQAKERQGGEPKLYPGPSTVWPEE